MFYPPRSVWQCGPVLKNVPIFFFLIAKISKLRLTRLNNRKVILGATEMIKKTSLNPRDVIHSLDYSLVRICDVTA